MWNQTKASQLLEIKYPIIQGPFGGRFSSAKLTSTVSNAGGLGSFGVNAYSPEEIRAIDASIKTLTNQPYALNLWVPHEEKNSFSSHDFEVLKSLFRPYFEELQVPLPQVLPAVKTQGFGDQIEAILEATPPVMSFIFGVPPKELIGALKAQKITLIATATTLEEAILIEEAGIDLVVASGKEAGGHRASFLAKAEKSLTTTFTLLEQLKQKLTIPVIAAGGINNGTGIYKALQAGASAVQIGTAFLATDESGASERHKMQLRAASPPTTQLTKVFTGRLGRAIANTLSADFAKTNQELLASFPLQSVFLSPLRKAAIEQGRWEYVAFWSGQFTEPLVHTDAHNLFQALVADMNGLTLA